MILYRCMTEYAINEGRKTSIFGPTHSFSTKYGGLGKIENDSCYNTFTHSQNKNLHFFRYAIDAIQYMDDEKLSWNNLSLCKFDIPDELLEKGYGFYLFQIRSEYVSTQDVPLSCLIEVIDQYNKRDLFRELTSDLDEAIYWHSTAGKAMTMTVNSGLNMGPLCGDIYHGGFMRVYTMFFDKLKNNRFYGIDDKFIEECTRKNLEAYDNSTIREDREFIEGKPHTDYWNGLTYEEINNLFNGYEQVYIYKTIASIKDIEYKSRNRKKEQI